MCQLSCSGGHRQGKAARRRFGAGPRQQAVLGVQRLKAHLTHAIAVDGHHPGREQRRGWLPSHTWLTVRQSDGRVVGIINYRPSPLSDFVLQYGGHIGYSIRLSERRKGYAKEQLRLTLEKCRAAGEDRVLLTCDHQGNPGSEKTILANGGVLENEVEDTPGLGNSGRIRRYWITL